MTGAHGSFWMLLSTTDPDILARMRDWIAAQLRGWSPQRVLDATLVLDELATNAFLHGEPPYRTRMVLRGDPDTVMLEVHDSGPWPLRPWELGAGLRLVASVARDWGVYRRNFRTVVWAQVPVDGVATPGT